MLSSPALLRINVGFIVNESIGYRREFSIEIPEISFKDDLTVVELNGSVLVSRTTEGLLVQGKGQAKTFDVCVYCLEGFQQLLTFDFVEMYTFPTHAVEETELILSDDLQINLAPLLWEYLELEIPINPVCRSDCKGLCPICGGNLNNASCNHDDELLDPRLSKLRYLLDDEDSPTG